MNRNDPFEVMCLLQRAALDGWINWVRIGLRGWERCADLQIGFFKGEVQQRWRCDIPRGPSLTDGYGRRARDIDPERDV